MKDEKISDKEESIDEEDSEEESIEEEEERKKKKKIKKNQKNKKSKKSKSKKKKLNKEKTQKIENQNFSISNIEFSKSENNSSENKEIKKLELFQNHNNSKLELNQNLNENNKPESKTISIDNSNINNINNSEDIKSNIIKEENSMTKKDSISKRQSLLDSSIFKDVKVQKKIAKQSKHLNIIRKFHEIYEKLSGKTFLVETEYYHQAALEYYRKSLNIEILISLSAFLSLLTGIVYYEISYKNNEEKPNNSELLLLYFLHLQTILFFIGIIMKEKIILKGDIEAKYENVGATLISTGRYIRIIIYLIFFGLHPSPMFLKIKFTEKTDEYTSPYSFNSMVLAFLLFRAYFIIRPFLYISTFMDIDSQYSCRQYSFNNSLLYCLKCLAQFSPIKLYISGFLLILFIMAYSVRIFERPANDSLDNYIDAIWLILITMTTVGYGDITAKTTGGRIISMISCLSGVFLTSMIIVTITNFLNLEPHEKRMLEILELTDELENEKELAKNIIQQYIGIIKKNCNGFNYNKIMNDYDIIRPLKDTIKELNKTQSNKFSPYSREFITLSNRIEFFIEFQGKIMEKRNDIYKDMKKLDLRIKKMREDNYIS